jgi:hypothetical protein
LARPSSSIPDAIDIGGEESTTITFFFKKDAAEPLRQRKPRQGDIDALNLDNGIGHGRSADTLLFIVEDLIALGQLLERGFTFLPSR